MFATLKFSKFREQVSAQALRWAFFMPGSHHNMRLTNPVNPV